MTREHFAACIRGLAPAVRDELAGLGAEIREVRPGGVSFLADRCTAYAANLHLRCAIRVQEKLVEGELAGPDDLYRLAGEVDWARCLRPNQTLAVSAACSGPVVTHSKYAAQRVKDAVVDQLRSRSSRRPGVDTKRPDLPLKLVVLDRRAVLYRDLSGESLHKRGWRPVQVKSPLNESLAAGILRLAGWDGGGTLVDPMCGSGTFPVEAALIASRRAPGLQRGFAFERWPDFDRPLWVRLRRAAEREVREHLPFPLEGADPHPGALRLARQGARRAGVGELVRFTRAEVARYEPGAPPDFVVVNPPYGVRLGRGDELEAAWRDLGDFLRHRAPGATAAVLSGNPGLSRHLKLKATRRWPVMNGPISCRLLVYRLHARDEA